MDDISKKLRKEALYLSYLCQDGNLQSVFSCLEIIWTLYDRVMHWDVARAKDSDRDYFIISKGQATLALYPVLMEKGLFDRNEIRSEIGTFHSRYCIQTDLTKFNGGIENSAGSLGHGLPFAVGIANANKIQKSPSQVYVLCGDGEFCEGTMWEACILAATLRLDNLCIVVDDNDSAGAMVELGNLQERLRVFGFDTEYVNGHDPEELERSFLALRSMKNGRPKALLAKTLRGYGSRTMMEQDIWFHKAPNSEELKFLQAEVDEN